MEGDAGPDQLNPTDADGVTELSEQTSEESPENDLPVPLAADEVPEPPPASRLGRGWFAALAAALILVAAGVGLAGYLALRSHTASETVARNDEAAVAAAKDCVAATHAPDASAMAASQMKIIDCTTGSFGTQATMFSGVLVDAYQAANVKVRVSDMRAAVEKNNQDGSIDVLVAVRTKMSNTDTEGKEQSYRLRLQMVPVDGQYKVAKLDQVSG